jgi:hypothetical protein
MFFLYNLVKNSNKGGPYEDVFIWGIYACIRRRISESESKGRLRSGQRLSPGRQLTRRNYLKRLKIIFDQTIV